MELSRILELSGLLKEDYWSSDVKFKHHAPEGLFSSDSSAQKIADWAWTAHKHDLKSSMSSLTFAINRAGKSMSNTTVAKIQAAKEILRKKAHKS